MSQYMHHIPGRLRIKSPLLKGNHGYAEQTLRSLSNLTGILSFQVNPVTGSMLVFYDFRTLASERILEAFENHGLVSRAGSAPEARQDRLSASSWPGYGKKILRAVAWAVIEKLAERSAVRLIGAIL